ncbi:MAG TPA: alpha/beta hydrolase [Anaerolineales bacterium]|jgi:pimeloyl-ACP methyl ester carboxylesterase
MRELRTINSHRIFVEARGPKKGHPVVLLHHGLGAVRSWRKQIPVLAKAGYRVLAYDRWGHGKSDPRSSWGMPYFESDRADLEQLLDGLRVERAALVGHSDGGKIALYFAADHPERVPSLVVVAAHIYVENRMGPGIQQVLNDFETDNRFREKLHRVHGEKAAALFRGWYSGWTNPAWVDWDMRPVLRKITCPALVAQGLEDEHATPQHARDLAGNIAGAELWLEPGIGHMLPQDAPEEFNRRLLEFLERNLWEQ